MKGAGRGGSGCHREPKEGGLGCGRRRWAPGTRRDGSPPSHGQRPAGGNPPRAPRPRPAPAPPRLSRRRRRRRHRCCRRRRARGCRSRGGAAAARLLAAQGARAGSTRGKIPTCRGRILKIPGSGTCVSRGGGTQLESSCALPGPGPPQAPPPAAPPWGRHRLPGLIPPVRHSLTYVFSCRTKLLKLLCLKAGGRSWLENSTGCHTTKLRVVGWGAGGVGGWARGRQPCPG